MILFSIPVHEQPAVIADQARNFIYFNPGCYIVLHVSGWMPDGEVEEMKKLLQGIDNVFVNERRLWSGYADGTQMKMHVVNYLYARKLGLVFDYFCPHASNDMFVRPGLYEYMQQYDAGGSFKEAGIENKDWVHMERALSDNVLRRIMKKNYLSKVYGGQVEGSFYSKPVMDKIIDRIMADGFHEIPGIYAHGTSARGSNLMKKKLAKFIFKRLSKGMFYAKEEIYFATLSQDLVHNRAPYNYCYVNWADGLKVTREDIDNIRSGNYAALSYTAALHYSLEEYSFFAVKRIDRKADDPMRLYIDSLQ